MSELPDNQQAQLLLEKNEIFVAPAEAHGVISGLLACGLSIEAKEYLALLSDVFNDGQSFSNDLKTFFATIYKQVVDSFSDEEFQFDLFLPSEDETLIDQANGLVSWIAGFMLGFGLKQKDYGKLSADVKEVIRTSPYTFNSAGITDEAVAMAYVIAEGKIDSTLNESTELIETYLMDRDQIFDLINDDNNITIDQLANICKVFR